MKTKALLLGLIGFFCASAPLYAGTSAEIEYRFRPIFKGPKLMLDVDLRFRGETSGTTRLLLPSQWAGQKKYYKAIHALEVATRGAILYSTEHPNIREIKHKPSDWLHVRYRVIQDWDGPIESELYYRTLLQPSYFHLPGVAFLVVPDWDERKSAVISLAWDGLPPSWSLANSFGVGDRIQRLTQSLDTLRHAIYVGGDFRLHKREINKRPVWIAMRGSWKFTDDKFAEETYKLIGAQRDFWKDDDFSYFLITLIPIGGSCCTTGGTGLTNSFAAFMSPEQELGAQVTHLLSHELFHTWNGHKIDRQQPERLVYWFSEGFTDFYTYVIGLRTGLITLDDYLKAYNNVLRKYYTSPVRTEPNGRIEKDFWDNGDVQKLPYQRGHILAHNWNARIKHRTVNSASLDDMMRDFLKAATTKGILVSSQSVNVLIRPYLSEGVAGDLKKYLEDGKLIAPDPQSLGPCVQMITRDIGPFELGFDWDKSQPAKAARGVIPGSAAYDAGLRDGQKMLAADIEWDNPAREVALEVKEGDKAKPIKYWPQRKRLAGEERPLVPEFKLDQELFKKDPAACLRWFF